MKGFYTPSSLVSKTSIPLLPQCGVCGLYKTCKSPKMKVDGRGRKKILLLGEAPGKNEDDKGVPFIGESGQLLERVLKRVGIDMREDCWITNSNICRPPDNRTPTDKEIDYCRPNLINTIKELNPNIIIPLGGIAIQSLIGWTWKESVGKVNHWLGCKIPNQRPNCWICPNWHPSYVSRLQNQEGKRDESRIVDFYFLKYLREAVN